MDIQILRDAAIDSHFEGEHVPTTSFELWRKYMLRNDEDFEMSPERRLAVRLFKTIEDFRSEELFAADDFSESERAKWLALIGEAAKAFAEVVPESKARLIHRALGDSPWSIGTDQPTPQRQQIDQPKAPPAWREIARDMGRKIVAENRKRGWSISQKLLSETLVTEFAKAGITDDDGKPLKATTIKRQALKGITNGKSQLLSTAGQRGKRGA